MELVRLLQGAPVRLAVVQPCDAFNSRRRNPPKHWFDRFAKEQDRLVERAAGFPKTVHGHEACFQGECMAGVSEGRQALAKQLLMWLRLICSLHASTKKGSGCLPCLAFTAGLVTRYAMVGSHTKSYPFKCEVLILERSSPATALGQFELAIAKDPELHLGARWPQIASELAFVLQLSEASLGPWQIFLLDAMPDQTSTVMVNAMTLMDLDELRDAETKRLERTHALRLLAKARQARSKAAVSRMHVRRAGKPRKGEGKG